MRKVAGDTRPSITECFALMLRMGGYAKRLSSRPSHRARYIGVYCCYVASGGKHSGYVISRFLMCRLGLESSLELLR